MNAAVEPQVPQFQLIERLLESVLRGDVAQLQNFLATAQNNHEGTEYDTLRLFASGVARLGFMRAVLALHDLGFDLATQFANGDQLFVHVAETRHALKCEHAFKNVLENNWEYDPAKLIASYRARPVDTALLNNSALTAMRSFIMGQFFTMDAPVSSPELASPLETLIVLNHLTSPASWLHPPKPYEELITPLHFVARQGCLACTQQLLIWNADMDARTSDGLSPLIHCAYLGQADAIKMLVEAGCDLYVRSVDDEWTRAHKNVEKTALDYAANQYDCGNASCGCHAQVSCNSAKQACATILRTAMQEHGRIPSLRQLSMQQTRSYLHSNAVSPHHLAGMIPDRLISFLNFTLI